MFDDFYGLEGRPFQLTPDPAFYFESLTHRKALSYLGYGLAQGEGFVVITGEVGAGKSTLVAHLMATIDPARLTAAQVVTSRLDGAEIIHVVAQAFGLMIEGHDKAGALGAIEAFLHEEARAGRRCLLIVDESQNLSIEALEELRMLSNFQLGAHPLLQTLLLGQPEFRDTLLEHAELEQLRQRVIATYHLQPMEAKEVQPYIEHRMKCVGWSGNPAFDQRVFAGIYDATGGIPRRINQIVNRLLLLGSVDERTRIDGAMLHQVLSEFDEDGTVSLLRATPAPKPVKRTEAEASPQPERVPEPEVPPQQEQTCEPGAGPEMSEQPEPRSEPEAPFTAEEAEAEVVDSEGRQEFVEVDAAVEAEPAEFVAEDAEAEIGEADFEIEGGEFSAPAESAGESCADEPQTAESPRDEAGSRDRKASPIDFAQPFEAGTESQIEEAIGQWDAEVAALRQAVYDLADAVDSKGGDKNSELADLEQRIEALEGRILEQDLTIRHTLTMLIEWIENGDGGREAA